MTKLYEWRVDPAAGLLAVSGKTANGDELRIYAFEIVAGVETPIARTHERGDFELHQLALGVETTPADYLQAVA